MEKARKYMDKFLEFIGSFLLILIVVLVLWQVIARTILNNPSTLTEETVRFSLIWLTMLTTAYVVGSKGHMAVTLLNDKLDGKKQKTLEIIVQALFILFSVVVMIYGGFQSVSITMAQVSPSMGLPMGYVYLAVPVSGVLMLLYSVLNLFDVLNGNYEPSSVDMKETELEAEDSLDWDGEK